MDPLVAFALALNTFELGEKWCASLATNLIGTPIFPNGLEMLEDNLGEIMKPVDVRVYIKTMVADINTSKCLRLLVWNISAKSKKAYIY
jgi:hypothetical protein